MKPRISVVINTLNEEKNLPYALRSVRTWADEIIVVDMHSDDRTVEIAKEYGAKVFFHERTGFSEPARAFAVSQATGDWVFLLDADEMIPRPLSEKLIQIASDDTVDVVVISWLNYLLGAPLWHTGWGPHQDRHPRFFRKNKIDLNPRIHGFIHPPSGARVLTLSCQNNLTVRHFNYVGCAHFIEKLNRYTTIEAQQAFERGEYASRARAALHAAFEFANRYLRKQGWRDGWRGFYLSGFMAMYRWSIYAKLQELHSTGGGNKIVEKYHLTAEEIVAGYGENKSHA